MIAMQNANVRLAKKQESVLEINQATNDDFQPAGAPQPAGAAQAGAAEPIAAADSARQQLIVGNIGRHGVEQAPVVERGGVEQSAVALPAWDSVAMHACPGMGADWEQAPGQVTGDVEGSLTDSATLQSDESQENDSSSDLQSVYAVRRYEFSGGAFTCRCRCDCYVDLSDARDTKQSADHLRRCDTCGREVCMSGCWGMVVDGSCHWCEAWELGMARPGPRHPPQELGGGEMEPPTTTSALIGKSGCSSSNALPSAQVTCGSGSDDGSGGAVWGPPPSKQLLAERRALRVLRIAAWRDLTGAGQEVVPPYSVDSYLFAEELIRGAAASSARE